MFKIELINELEIVAHRGAETASTSLSSFLNNKVVITITNVEMADIDVIPEKLGNSEDSAIGLLTLVRGEIKGNAALLFTFPDACRLIGILGRKKVNAVDEYEFNEMERSMLEETANITISSFMNCMTSHLGRKCIPNAPIFLKDMAGAILSVMLMESAEVADQAVLFSTTFKCENEDLKALFTFLPSPSSLLTLQEGLEDD